MKSGVTFFIVTPWLMIRIDNGGSLSFNTEKGFKPMTVTIAEQAG
jgi:hypothetical protein